MKKLFISLMAFTALTSLLVNGYLSATLAQEPEVDSSLESEGKLIFFDPDLSVNGTQSHASCLTPEAGWTGPDALENAGTAVYQGALPHCFGNRKPPPSGRLSSS
jgi:cytochrome c peroxidase